MHLHMTPVEEGFAHADRLDAVNREAFPEEERVPTGELLRMAREGIAHILALYDGQEFIGFLAYLTHGALFYITFFAIHRSRRNQGYGGAVLKKLREQYPHRQFVLDLEPLDENAGNLPQRKRRRNFYLRSGFHATGYFMRYRGLTFEILCTGDAFDLKGFSALLDTLRSPAFQPVLFRREEEAGRP